MLKILRFSLLGILISTHWADIRAYASDLDAVDHYVPLSQEVLATLHVVELYN